jgi:hypothetical protein
VPAEGVASNEMLAMGRLSPFKKIKRYTYNIMTFADIAVSFFSL